MKCRESTLYVVTVRVAVMLTERVALQRRTRFTHTIYVGRDDWAASDRLRPWPGFRQAYADSDRRDVSVFTVSQELADRVRPDGTAVVRRGGSRRDQRPRAEDDRRGTVEVEVEVPA